MLVDRDRNSAYTDYVEALEGMRGELTAESEAFYIELLGTPLEQRWALLQERARQSPAWQNADFRKRWRKWERTLQGR